MDGLLKRGVASGEIQRIRQSLPCLSTRFLRSRIDPFTLAQRVYGPSYISLEGARSHHGWIPEAVPAITSASLERSREFLTPLDLFAFVRIPQTTFFSGVERVTATDGAPFFIASPVKALADYVYGHQCDWQSADPIIASLRVEPEMRAGASPGMFEELAGVHRSARVRRFLDGPRKDLKK